MIVQQLLAGIKIVSILECSVARGSNSMENGSKHSLVNDAAATCSML